MFAMSNFAEKNPGGYGVSLEIYDLYFGISRNGTLYAGDRGEGRDNRPVGRPE